MKIRYLTIVSFLVCSSWLYAQDRSNWVSVGPSFIQSGTGRVMAINFDPNKPSIIYAGTPAGGLWKFDPSSNSWQTLTDGLSSLGVSDIAINPQTSNQIFILTGDGFPFTASLVVNTIGVMKSNDGGATWANTGLTSGSFTRGRRLLMDPINTNVLLAATNVGIYRTTDGGANWSLVQSGNFFDCQFKPSDNNVVYASTASQFWRSTDNGATWNQITSGLPTPTCTSYNPPDNANIARIAVSANKNDYVYILFDCQGYIVIHLSTNSGVDFGPNRFTNPPSPPWVLSNQTFNFAFGADPKDANVLFAGGAQLNYLFKSTDGGTTWNQTPAGIVHPDFSTIKFNGDSIYVGTDGGIYKSTDGANTFTDLTAGMTITQIWNICGTPQDSNLFYFGSQDDGSSKFLDSSHLNKKVFGGDGGGCLIDYTNVNSAYGEQGANIWETTDGGNTTNTITPPVSGSPPGAALAMDPISPQTIYAGYTDIFKTTDGGKSWSKVLNNVGMQIAIGISASDPKTIYSAEGLKVRKSTDAGSTWTNITGSLPVGPLSINSLAVSSTDSQKLWITLTGGSPNKVFQSKNGGGTWNDVTGSLPNITFNRIASEGSHVDSLYLGTDKGVYYRDNKLGDWTAFSNGLPKLNVNDFYINVAARKIAAATFGRGIWTSNLYLQSYQRFIVQMATPLVQSEDANGSFMLSDLDRDGIPDLYFIKRKSTASNSIEVHVLSGKSNYKQFLMQEPTPIPQADNANGDFMLSDFDKDGLPDLYFIKRRNTNSGTVEVHVLSGKSNYKNFLVQEPTPIPQADDVNGDFMFSDYDHDGVPDLVFLKRRNTQTKMIEVHVLSGKTDYRQFLLQIGSGYDQADDINGDFMFSDFDKDGFPDLYFLKRRNTESSTIEVHIVSGK